MRIASCGFQGAHEPARFHDRRDGEEPGGVATDPERKSRWIDSPEATYSESAARSTRGRGKVTSEIFPALRACEPEGQGRPRTRRSSWISMAISGAFQGLRSRTRRCCGRAAPSSGSEERRRIPSRRSRSRGRGGGTKQRHTIQHQQGASNAGPSPIDTKEDVGCTSSTSRVVPGRFAPLKVDVRDAKGQRRARAEVRLPARPASSRFPSTIKVKQGAADGDASPSSRSSWRRA